MCCVNARHRFRITFRKNSYVKHMTAKLACNILLFFVFAHAKTYHAHSRAFLISTLKHWRARLYFTWWLFIILKFLFRVICFHKLKTRNVQSARAPFSCFEGEIPNSNMAHMWMQSKCASYYFARQNCSACTQKHIGARGTRFNLVKSFVRNFHCSAACLPYLDCILRKQSLMKQC